MKSVMRAVIVAVPLLSTSCTVHQYHLPPASIIRPTVAPEEALKVKREDVTEKREFVARFLSAYDQSYNNYREAPQARELTRYGMTVIDIRCDLFFEQIGRGAQDGDFIRREFQSVSAALIAALGLAKSSGDAITGVGIGSALGLQTIDNYSTVYFFSPDVGAVQLLVRRAFQSLRAELLSSDHSPKDFDEAIGALRTYQNVCTAHEIKRLVTEAIDSGKPVAQFGAGDAERFSAAGERALAGMAAALGVETLDLREAAVLELLLAQRPKGLNAEGIDYACSTLPADVRGKVCTETASIPVFATPNSIAGFKNGSQLEAGWSTLKAIIGDAYAREVQKQVAVIEGGQSVYRQALMDRAQAEADKKAARDDRERAEAAERKLAEAQTKLDQLEQAPRLESERMEAAPVIGVKIDPNATQP